MAKYYASSPEIGLVPLKGDGLLEAINGGSDPEQVSTDLAPHQCSLPRLAPVELESPGD